MIDQAKRYGDWGLGAGFGAEGKIKARGNPWQLTPCLHIIFGVTPVKAGVTPFLAQPVMVIGASGVHPSKNHMTYRGCIR